jgi:RND superfamily putative drug exporter
MFHFLGKTVARFWPIFLVAWVFLLVWSKCCAPGWDAATSGLQIAMLPPDAPSRQADQLFREAFPGRSAGSNIVLVLWRDQGELNDDDEDFIAGVLTDRLWQLAEPTDDEPSPISNIRTLADPGAGALLVSPDRKATLAVAEVKSSFENPRVRPAVAQVESLVKQLREEKRVPDGLHVAITGSATAGRDLLQGEAESVRVIEVWTIIVVVVLLLLLYRSVLVALIPLVTVYLAIEVALGLMSVLVQAGVFVADRDSRIFITVLAYGAGVDYCLFLIARYREGLDAGHSPGEATSDAIRHVGAAIVASAATVIGGIAMLAFARFEKIHLAGVAIPVALAVVLCATLTFSAVLLRLAGRWAFWPHHTPALHPRCLLPDTWGRLGTAMMRRPGLIWLGSMAALLPFVVVAAWRYNDQNYNPISDLPTTAPSSAGTRVLQEHFPPGVVAPVTVLLKNDRVDFSHKKGIDLVDRLTERLRKQADELALADIRSVAQPLGITSAAERAREELPVSARDVPATLRREAVKFYVNQKGELKGHVTRIDLELATDPFARRAIDDLSRIESAIRADLPAGLEGSQIAISGATASARDIALLKHGDQRRIEVLVPTVVLLLLLALLRRLVISIYLVFSVLFSYLATLGATYLFFWLLDPSGFVGLDWKVPIFLFTILVAVGEDYNIFLLTRIQEEQKRHGPLNGIAVALCRTGRVISSCGFLMAGTFASLLSGSLLAMKELGFALALGVLLDTLVVRPILVPSFLVLLQSGRLGKLGQYVALEQEEAPPTRAA